MSNKERTRTLQIVVRPFLIYSRCLYSLQNVSILSPSRSAHSRQTFTRASRLFHLNQRSLGLWQTICHLQHIESDIRKCSTIQRNSPRCLPPRSVYPRSTRPDNIGENLFRKTTSSKVATVFLLDEPSSSLVAKKEHQLFERLRKEREGRITIYFPQFAHLSCVRRDFGDGEGKVGGVGESCWIDEQGKMESTRVCIDFRMRLCIIKTGNRIRIEISLNACYRSSCPVQLDICLLGKIWLRSD